MTEDHDTIRYASLSWATPEKPYGGQIEFTGMSKPEVQAMEAALNGANWVRVKDGRLQVAHAHDEPPNPEPDRDIGPFWPQRPSNRDRRRKVRKLRFDEPGFSEAGIHIAHLGAGCIRERFEDAYERNAEILESYGFECLRSRRGEGGRFWEIWYLPSLFLAEGELAAAIAKVKSEGRSLNDATFQKRRMDAAISFLCRNVNFGTLDAFIQRAALSYDDMGD